MDGRYWEHSHRTTQAMSEEQLSALLAKLKDDAALREKLQGGEDLDAAVVLAKEAGFDVSKEDLLKYQESLSIDLSNEELEGVAGGGIFNKYVHTVPPYPGCAELLLED